MNNMSSENNIVSSNSDKWMTNGITNSDIANQVISKYTSTNKHSSSGIGTNNNKRKMVISKDDEEYAKKRERNNVAVKKSREKAKHRIQETQCRVEQLSKENEDLQTKVTLLTKELNVLRALFTNGGFSLPAEFPQYSDTHSSTSSDRLSPVERIVESHRHDDSSRIPSHVQHSSTLSIKQESPKSAFHSIIDESKVPPLRPMPRVASNSPSNKELHSPVRNYEGVFQTSRDSRDREMYSSYKSSGSHYSGSEKSSSIVMMPQGHGQSLNSHSSPYSTSHYSRSPENQHTSVIRSAAEVASSNNLPSQQNKVSTHTLGQFCIISDPENNGAVKIVPMSS